MGRRAEGWKLVFDAPHGLYCVRFTFAGRRYKLGTGERDPAKAARAAERIYAEVVSGRRRKAGAGAVGYASDLPLDELAAKWLVALRGSLDERTLEEYEIYARSHWLPYFETLDRITAESGEDYWRARLRSVQATTVRKELSALRGFLGWCASHGFLEMAPVISSPPRKAVGTVAHKRETVVLEESEVRALLCKLPEWTAARRGPERGKPFAVRARFQLAWETGLRPGTLDELRVPDNYRKGAKALVLGRADDKNRAARPIPLTPAARAALSRVAPPSGLIFGAHDYREVLRKAAREAKLPEHRAAHVTEQCFRHSRLTHWVGEGRSLLGVQYLAGHARLTTTEKYTRASLRAAEEITKRPRRKR